MAMHLLCRFFAPLCLCLTIATASSSNPPSATKWERRPYFGAVVGHELIGGIEGHGDKKNLFFIEDLSVEKSPKRVRIELDDWIWEKSRFDRLFRWRVRGDFLWCVQQGLPGNATSFWFGLVRIPLSGLPREETQPLFHVPWAKMSIKEHWNESEPFPKPPGEWAREDDHGMSYNHVATWLHPLMAAAIANGFDRNIHYDLWPTGDRQCLAFAIHEPTNYATGSFHVASDHRYLQVSEYRFAYGPDNDRRRWRGAWKLVENIDCTFNEPFFAVPSGAEYLFVTESGAVYGTQKNEATEKRTTTILRNGSADPVVALIQNAALTRVQAFTATSTFVLSPQLREERFVLGVRGDRDTEAVFPILRTCAKRFADDTH
jgi:hypothetical protein